MPMTPPVPGLPASAGDPELGTLADPAGVEGLRRRLHALPAAAALHLLDDHDLVPLLCAVPSLARAAVWSDDRAPGLQLRRLALAASVAAPAASAPAPARAAARSAAPAAAPAPGTFDAELDVIAMVAVLQGAARAGLPFCEECAGAVAQA